MGPFRATLFFFIDSITEGGRGVPYFSITSAPASWISHSISTPVASITFLVTAVISGPTPVSYTHLPERGGGNLTLLLRF